MEKNNGILNRIVDNITVSNKKYEDAENRYKSLSNWFKRQNSSLLDTNASIYTHGSFLLETAINPLSGDEYDLDIMCCLKRFDTNTITQKELKEKIGAEIISYAETNGMEKPEDKTRAWTINYSEKSQFHMDIMPSIPSGISKDIVFIPYKDSAFYNLINNPWEKSSNPKGFLNWFRSISKVNFNKKRLNFAYERNVKIEEIPKHSIRSTLQEVVMLLKRHRDVFFNNINEKDNIDAGMIKKEKVTSIIITTLAGKAYNQEEELTDAFFNIVDRIEDYILENSNSNYNHFRYTDDYVIGNKLFRIENPANPDENFTDKWSENPYKKIAFFNWIKQLKKDANCLKELVFCSKSNIDIVYKMFGENIKNDITNYITKDIENNEEFYIEKPRYEKKLITKVSVNCYSSNKDILEDIDSALLLQYLVKSNQCLKKESFLLFVANINSSIKQPFEVIWQVANKGIECVRKNQIRGELSQSDYFHRNFQYRYQRAERTSYSGTHWVKCYIVKNETIIAESDKFYVKVV